MNLKELNQLTDSYCLIPPNEYLLFSKITLNRTYLENGPTLWEIRQNNSLLSKKSNMLILPLVQEDFKNCRFESIEAALECFKKYLEVTQRNKLYLKEVHDYIRQNFPHQIY